MFGPGLCIVLIRACDRFIHLRGGVWPFLRTIMMFFLSISQTELRGMGWTNFNFDNGFYSVHFQFSRFPLKRFLIFNFIVKILIVAKRKIKNYKCPLFIYVAFNFSNIKNRPDQENRNNTMSNLFSEFKSVDL